MCSSDHSELKEMATVNTKGYNSEGGLNFITH